MAAIPILSPRWTRLPLPETRPPKEDIERLIAAFAHLGRIFEKAAVCPSHGAEHARQTMRLAELALLSDLERGQCRLWATESFPALLAALLHDADDRKIFPGHHYYENACEVLRGIKLEFSVFDIALRQIQLVSASSQGNKVPPDALANPWLLYPRHADRRLALGNIGLHRVYVYNKGNVTSNAQTPRPATAAEVRAAARPQRFVQYQKTGVSVTTVDHFYDKLLHIAEGLRRSQNAFFVSEADAGEAVLVEACLRFARGEATADFWAAVEAKALAEVAAFDAAVV